MRRREFITLLGGAAAWPLAARAQQPSKPPTIGVLAPGTPSSHRQWVAALVQRLQELGWIDGRTIAIEYRWAEGSSERAAQIATEFVGLKVDVIVTSATAVTFAAKQATSAIPIVFASAGGPRRERSGRKSGATRRQPYRPVTPIHRSRRQENRTFT